MVALSDEARSKLAFLVNFLIFVGVGLATGLGSAWYMIEHGTSVTTEQIGPWVVWTAAGRADADPYTRAYIARSGRLPINSASARYYLASTDSDGRKLDADCEYEAVGRGPQAEWWSLAAYDDEGMLMPNAANRYSFNSTAILRDESGAYRIALARQARPGNWLPINSDYKFTLLLRTYQPELVDEEAVASNVAPDLPVLRRLTCG